MGVGVRKISFCRICNSRSLVQFLDLGLQPLANSFLREEQLGSPEPVYPLRVVFCEDCGLVQLRDVVDPEAMFRNYLYFSSGMPASKHFRDYAESLIRSFVKNKDDLVVEIGSNDGHFLAVVKESGCRILGIDPAKNIAGPANERGISTITEFFSETVAKDTATKYGRAKVIVGNNVVAHIDDHHDMAKGIGELLSDDGVFVFEAPYLVDMFENLSFDTIYHEHLSYLAIRPLLRLFAAHGLEIFDVQIHPIQGNSLRVFVAKRGMRTIHPSVKVLEDRELALKLNTRQAYQQLAAKILKLKQEVGDLIHDLKVRKQRIGGYGAPAKGNTLLNYFGIGRESLEYVTEELPSKIGLYTPGTHLPVVHVEEFRRDNPDYAFLLAWNYKNVVLEKEKAFRERGGKFIMPIGSERIL